MKKIIRSSLLRIRRDGENKPGKKITKTHRQKQLKRGMG